MIKMSLWFTKNQRALKMPGGSLPSQEATGLFGNSKGWGRGGGWGVAEGMGWTHIFPCVSTCP